MFVSAATLACNTLVGFSDLEKVDAGSGGATTGGGGTTSAGGSTGGADGGAGATATITLDDAVVLGLTTGRHGTCVTLEADGSVLCWGEHTGNAASPSSTTPVPVEGLTGITSVGIGLNHRCAFNPTEEKVYCWGNNDHGQLGDGTFISSVTPVEVQGLPPVERISVSGDHNCALTPDDPAVGYCWGANTYGQLGTGDQIDSAVPLIVGGLVEPIRVAVGTEYTVAVGANGDFYAWGRNDAGQLGIDPATSQMELSPQLVAAIPALERAYPSHRHTCGRTQGAREMVCWGNNDFGQLGDGTTTSRHASAVVNGLNEIVVGYPGERHTCAAETLGAVLCFGANDFGQLGQPATPTPVSIPLQISADSAVIGAKTSEHTCFADKDGPVQCMGLNASGQIGDGTYDNRDAPTSVTYAP